MNDRVEIPAGGTARSSLPAFAILNDRIEGGKVDRRTNPQRRRLRLNVGLMRDPTLLGRQGKRSPPGPAGSDQTPP